MDWLKGQKRSTHHSNVPWVKRVFSKHGRKGWICSGISWSTIQWQGNLGYFMTTGNKKNIFFTNSRIAKYYFKYTVRAISLNRVPKKLDLLQFHCLNTCVSLLKGSISFCHCSYNLHVTQRVVKIHCVTQYVTVLPLILQNLIFHQTAFPQEVSITRYCIFFNPLRSDVSESMLTHNS